MHTPKQSCMVTALTTSVVWCNDACWTGTPPEFVHGLNDYCYFNIADAAKRVLKTE